MSGTIDLRKCKRGDILISSHGAKLEYICPTPWKHFTYLDHVVRYVVDRDGNDYGDDTYGTRTHDGFVYNLNRIPETDEDIVEIIPVKQEIFTTEFLDQIGFTVIELKRSEYKPYPLYGKAKDRTGMTIINWCDEGHSCTYFGEKLEPNTSVGIKKDGGTRTAFSGYVFSQDDMLKVLQLTW